MVRLIKPAFRFVATAFFAALVAVLLLGQPVHAVPPKPFNPYGTVMIDGSSVPAGTPVVALCGGVQYASTGTVIDGGQSWYLLNVPGDDPETSGVKEGCASGETVIFTVNGVPAQQTAPWVEGASQRLDLSAVGTGALQAAKTVNWNGVTPEADAFEICITGPSYPTTPNCKTFTYPAALTQTWSDLIPGSYTITEAAQPEWTTTVTGSPAAVAAGATATASVSNTRKLGSLEVGKTVNWNGNRLLRDLHQRPLLPNHPQLQEHHRRPGPGRRQAHLERPHPRQLHRRRDRPARMDHHRQRLTGHRPRQWRDGNCQCQ
jgi:hypothetical protein